MRIRKGQPQIMAWLFETLKLMFLFLFFFSIMNSLVIVLFLSGMVAMIMLRTLHKDIARYNQIDSAVRTIVAKRG